MWNIFRVFFSFLLDIEIVVQSLLITETYI